MKTAKTAFFLDNASIDKTVQLIRSRLEEAEIERRNILRHCLSAEELLLRWQDRFGTGQTAELEFISRFGQQSLCLRTVGEPCNPLDQSREEAGWSARILESLGLGPAYSYRGGVNSVVLKPRRQKDNSTSRLLLCAAAAAALGIAGMLLMPERAASAAELLLQPLRSSLMGLLTAAALPMIFLSILLSVCGAGDISTFSSIGRKILSRFLLISFAVTLAAGLLFTPFFSLQFGGGRVDMQQLGAALQMLLDVLPENLFEPFIAGHTLQLLIIAVAGGLALLLLGEQGATLRRAAEEFNAAIYLFLEWISRLIPLIVFLMLLEMFWTGTYRAFLSIWKPLLLSAGAGLLLASGYVLRVSRRLRISPLKILRKIAPVQLIAFATASTAATYGSNLDCCKKELGIDEKFVGFGLPVGQSIFDAPLGTWYMACVLYGAETCGTEVSLVWLLVAWLTAALFSCATPPIPGGSIACYAILFSQMGIPAGAIASIITVDVLIDHFSTPMKITSLQMELVLSADRMGLLDRERLCR